MDEPFVTTKRYLKAIDEPMRLAVQRNQKYGNSIEMMSNQSITELVMMKLHRLKNIPPTDWKVDDEYIDCINYLVYIRMRMMRGDSCNTTA